MRELPGTAKRFWVLVVLTGAASGFAAVLLVQLLRAVERLAWPSGPTFIAAVEHARPGYRLLICALGGRW